MNEISKRLNGRESSRRGSFVGQRKRRDNEHRRRQNSCVGSKSRAVAVSSLQSSASERASERAKDKTSQRSGPVARGEEEGEQQQVATDGAQSDRARPRKRARVCRPVITVATCCRRSPCLLLLLSPAEALACSCAIAARCTRARRPKHHFHTQHTFGQFGRLLGSQVLGLLAKRRFALPPSRSATCGHASTSGRRPAGAGQSASVHYYFSSFFCLFFFFFCFFLRFNCARRPTVKFNSAGCRLVRAALAAAAAAADLSSSAHFWPDERAGAKQHRRSSTYASSAPPPPPLRCFPSAASSQLVMIADERTVKR